MPGGIGVFICGCGPNIGERIDIDRLAEEVSGIDGVSLVQQHALLCSPAGQTFLSEAIREAEFDRVVVAACSPREHLETFMGVCDSAGLNPFMLQMVNIREQCAWVTDDIDLATVKALRMIRGAVSRSALHRPLQISEISCSPDVAVIGSGAAGLRTALALSSTDRKITLIERDTTIGGRHSDMETVVEMIGQVEACDDILFMTGTEPVDIRGFFGNFILTMKDGEEFETGAVVLATGSADADHLLKDFGYGTLDNVITAAEAARMLDSDQFSLRDGSVPRSLAIINCSARGQAGYCSVVCCDDTLNLATNIAALPGQIGITLFHGQICTSLHSHRTWLESAGDLGCILRNTLIEGIQSTDAGLVPEQQTQGSGQAAFDMVILQPPQAPSPGFDQLAAILRVATDPGGYPLPEHDRLSTVTTAIDGIHLAGAAAGPCRMNEALQQAEAAAGTILSTLVPGKKVQTEPCTSVITESLCMGCRTCMEICAYGAISWSGEKRVCSVNTVLCRGCGGCAAACPSGAARASHFTSGQLRRQVVGVLE